MHGFTQQQRQAMRDLERSFREGTPAPPPPSQPWATPSSMYAPYGPTMMNQPQQHYGWPQQYVPQAPAQWSGISPPAQPGYQVSERVRLCNRRLNLRHSSVFCLQNYYPSAQPHMQQWGQPQPSGAPTGYDQDYRREGRRKLKFVHVAHVLRLATECVCLQA